jgi:hypothetical protein
MTLFMTQIRRQILFFMVVCPSFLL